ncbi:MAG: glutamyl-tRNA reductase [Candidatus Dormibacteria bacterium]
MRVVTAGVSFRTAPLAVLESAAVRDEDARGLLRYLVGHAGFGGAAVLSTCNRTELYLTCVDDTAEDAAARIAPHLDPGDEHHLARHLTQRWDADAVHHLFRVAAGLESMVIGEAQVLGQLRDAHRLAQAAGTLDARLDFVMRRAISTGKLVRSATEIGRGAGSLSEVAVDVARSVNGSLRDRGVLLVGAGKMSALAASRLQEEGARILTTSRGDSKTQLARVVGARAVGMDALVDIAPSLDVLICSTTSAQPVITAALVGAMQQRRHHAALCIVDIAVPRDVECEAATVPGVTLVDIDELGRRLDRHLSSRARHVPEAERIVHQELRRTMAVIGERDAASPTISALLRRAEGLRRREVERTLARSPELDAATRERIDVLTQSLVRKLLHGPVTHLREAAGDPSVALVLREAFDLDEVEVTGAAGHTRQRAGTGADVDR